MKKLILLLSMSLVSSAVLSHSNENPLKDLRKNQIRLSEKQQLFENLTNLNEQYESLQEQTNYLQKNVFILRNLMAKDYPHVKDSMSKYKLDYIEQVENSLKMFTTTLEQMKESMQE